MTRPLGVGEPLQLVMAAQLGEDGQGEGSKADAKRQQRGDGVAGMGGPLARWPASIPKPLAADDPGDQELTAGDEYRNGVLHAGMLADPRPWLRPTRSGGGP